MTTIDAVDLGVDDPAASEIFYKTAFDLDDRVRVHASEEPTSGFRGFTLSLVVSQPSNVDALVGAALDGGATTLKPAKKGFWGYGGVVQAPDGAIWKVATSSKKDTGPASREVDEVVLLLGVEDVKATKQFYVDHGLEVGKSFGSKYVEFTSPGSPSSWRSTDGARPPRTPAWPRRAAARTGSSSSATPARSPTRTGSRGRPCHADRSRLTGRPTTVATTKGKKRPASRSSRRTSRRVPMPTT